MSTEPLNPSQGTGLQILREARLAKLPNGDSLALTEIISRSLRHIQTSRDLVLPARKAGEECEFEIAPGVKIVMCWIPPGQFLMGSPEDEKNRNDDETQHRVKLTHGFWLAKIQTTQAQWQAVMGYNPSRLKGEDLPVECVSWDDICGDESGTGGFLGRLNRLLPTSGRFHLPTEAQWEYACRAGTIGPFAGDLDTMAWHLLNSEKMVHAVGCKKPNRFGLNDMHGNVWEWCADWYGEYGIGFVTDPRGPISGTYRVYRGGSRTCVAHCSRSSRRGDGFHPDFPGRDLGFRVAHSPATMDNKGHNR